MYNYHFGSLNQLLEDVIHGSVTTEAFEWLKQQASPNESPSKFNTVFVTVPRKTGKGNIHIDESVLNRISELRPGFKINGWSIDRLARVWLLMQLDSSSPESYFKKIDSLFLAAEVNELVALYSALPVLAHPELWKARCAEGIRNNISDVLTAIMCNNPYPSEQLSNAAWNQLVLKAFFTEKPTEQIIGLEERSNPELASTLIDFAHERWAAGRAVSPQIWRCVAPFIDEHNIEDIRRLSLSDDPFEQEAAALAASSSDYLPAKKLINPALMNRIVSGELTWSSLALKTKNHVLQ